MYLEKSYIPFTRNKITPHKVVVKFFAEVCCMAIIQRKQELLLSVAGDTKTPLRRHEEGFYAMTALIRARAYFPVQNRLLARRTALGNTEKQRKQRGRSVSWALIPDG